MGRPLLVIGALGDLLRKAFDETKHVRQPKGSGKGGQFAPKGGGKAGGGAAPPKPKPGGSGGRPKKQRGWTPDPESVEGVLGQYDLPRQSDAPQGAELEALNARVAVLDAFDGMGADARASGHPLASAILEEHGYSAKQANHFFSDMQLLGASNDARIASLGDDLLDTMLRAIGPPAESR